MNVGHQQDRHDDGVQCTATAPVSVAESAGTNRFGLEALLAVLALGLASWIFATTLLMIWSGYAALPHWDQWDTWREYITQHYSLSSFFQQHNEHRLLIPKLLFAVDHLVFGGREWFLLTCTFLIQAVMAIVLWRFSPRSNSRSRSESVMIGAVLAACLFSAQQWVNFIWGFQVQFMLVYCMSLGALFALCKGSRHAQDGHGTAFLVASIAMAAIATYSMANGLLLWPLLFLLALWLQVPRRWTVAIAVSAVIAWSSYLYGLHRVGNPDAPFIAIERLPQIRAFWSIHLASPLAVLGSDRPFVVATAGITGSLLVLTVAAGVVLLWLRRRLFSPEQAVLLHAAAFAVGSSLLISIGRSGTSGLGEAVTPRYLTPAYFLWVCVLLCAWPFLIRLSRSALYGLLCAALFMGIAMHQTRVIRAVQGRAESITLGKAAIVGGVIDPEAWRQVYHTPHLAIDSVKYLKENHLSLFAEEWTRWPGIQLDRRFAIDRNQNACRGSFEDALAVQSPVASGWRVSGWAWDVKASRVPQFVILAGDDGVVAGVALAGFSSEGFPGIPSPYPASIWHGYVSGAPRSITAYAVEADGHTVCTIGGRWLRPPLAEVPFTKLAGLLKDAQIAVEGVWAKDGYFPEIGRPPVAGTIMASWVGSDANTGTLRLGPFHYDGSGKIAIPLVTGPKNQGLSLQIRDAVTQKPLTILEPVPLRQSWWAWVPDLPTGKSMSIEIVAVDQGSGWGQWQALGWPHLLEK